MENIKDNWEYILLVFFFIEKLVKLTPCKWDDVVFDMVLKPIFNNLNKKSKK